MCFKFLPCETTKKKRIIVMTKKLIKTLLVLICAFCMNLADTANAAQSPSEIKSAIVKTAVNMGVDPCIALSIAKLESEFIPTKKGASGAVGLFQLMPDTARRLGVNPYLVNDNIKGGIMYYRMMYKKFGSTDLALAAYNAGPGNVARYKGVPPFRETKAFIAKIKSQANQFKQDPAVIKHTTPQRVQAPLPTL